MGAKVTIEVHNLGEHNVPVMIDRKTMDEAAVIQEAIDSGYVTGKASLITQNVKGVITAMCDGVARDGNGRKIDGYLSLQPVAKGRLDDVTDPIDKDKISVELKARMLKETKLDTSDWEITCEGSTGNLTITSISTGETLGRVTILESVNLNGKSLKMSDGDTITWEVAGTSLSGTIPSALIYSDSTRITIASEAFAELELPELSGKTLVLKVKIGNNQAVKSAEIVIAD